MKNYILERRYFENVTEHQLNEMLSSFEVNDSGDLIIPYSPKSYRVNRTKSDFTNGISAISMFSGAGGLDIGTQLAGVKVISSLDFFEDSVRTLSSNNIHSSENIFG